MNGASTRATWQRAEYFFRHKRSRGSKMPICLHLGKQTSAFMTSKNNLSQIHMSQELY